METVGLLVWLLMQRLRICLSERNELSGGHHFDDLRQKASTYQKRNEILSSDCALNIRLSE